MRYYNKIKKRKIKYKVEEISLKYYHHLPPIGGNTYQTLLAPIGGNLLT